MAIHVVAELKDLPDGSRRIVEVEGKSIGIYRIGDEVFALNNYCPHLGAELCKGPVCGTTLDSDVYEFVYGRDREIVRCPWHGWEFDIKTGVSLFSDRVRTRSYKVEVRDGKIGIVLGPDR